MRLAQRRARRLVLRQFPQGSVGAEIGVWRGDFAARILQVVRPARLHLIDPWQFMDAAPYRRAWYGGAAARDQAFMDRLHAEVVDRFASETARGVVSVHRLRSAEAVVGLPDRYFDWIYVDGDHLYESVHADLELFEPKVRPGGVIAGDDYGMPGWWEDGVTRAVDEFVAARGCEVAMLRAGQFALRLPDA